MRTLELAGLTLEPQVAAHAAQMFAVLADPAIYEHENEPPPSEAWLYGRFLALESRRSPDGREQWLNWVIRLPTSQLAGSVQATVRAGGQAGIAYELASAYWGRGLAQRAVEGMIDELARSYRVRCLSAVLKRGNLRSMRLLQRLGFALASPQEHHARKIGHDEYLMVRGVNSGCREAPSASGEP